MVDPNLLVDYVYQSAIQHHWSEVRKGLEMDMHNDIDLFRSIYSETSSAFPNPLHNQHINLYYQAKFTTEWVKSQNKIPVRIPSKIYFFDDKIPPNGFITPGEMTDDLWDCAIYVNLVYNSDAVTSCNLMSLCHKISQHQYVSDLHLFRLNCDDSNEIDCFNVSKQCKSIHVNDCSIPSQVLVHLQQQLCHCPELQILRFLGN